MTPLVEFLKRGVVPEDKEEARKLRSFAPKYTMREDNLFKRGYSMPLLRCLTDVEARKASARCTRGCAETTPPDNLGIEAAKTWIFLADLEKGLSRVGQKM